MATRAATDAIRARVTDEMTPADARAMAAAVASTPACRNVRMSTAKAVVVPPGKAPQMDGRHLRDSVDSTLRLFWIEELGG
jgi:hypothetical protein